MSKLLLLLALLSLGSCASVHLMVAPHATIRHYHRWQRTHERECRRQVKTHPNVTWSKL